MRPDKEDYQDEAERPVLATKSDEEEYADEDAILGTFRTISNSSTWVTGRQARERNPMISRKYPQGTIIKKTEKE